MLKPAAHQVAGHGYGGGNTGPLTDSAGRFYKPMQDRDRGDREIAFYNNIQGDDRVSGTVRSYFPRFYGTIQLPGSDANASIRHGMLEDLTHAYRHPSIIDLKMGVCTWYPEASEKYIKKSIEKDKETTSGALGFRVSGMQVHDPAKGTTWKADRVWCRKLTVDGVTQALKRYVSSNPWEEPNPDAAFAPLVFGGPHGVLAQLQVLKNWFESQTCYHFFSTSILLSYEGDGIVGAPGNADAVAELPSVSVKLVDFAHTFTGKSSTDENFLQGLKSLICILQGIVDSLSNA